MSAVTTSQLQRRTRRALPALIDPGRQLESLVDLGYSLLTLVDHLGGWVLDVLAARRLAALQKNRISWSSKMIVAGLSALAGLFAWGAAANVGTGNAWLSAGPAGAASSAVTPAQTTSATVPAQSAAHASIASPTSKGSSPMTKKMSHPMRHVVLAGFTGAAMMGGGVAALAAPAGAAAVPATAHSAKVVHKTLDIVTGKNGWPEFKNSKDIVFPKNATVVLTIRSDDDGAAPLPKNVVFYDKVMGTVKDHETVDGKTYKNVKNSVVSHTFTVAQLGLNIPVPKAPTGKIVVVRATFHTGKAGTYTWQCYAPCGTGKNGEKGPMVMNGFMKGKVTIK